MSEDKKYYNDVFGNISPEEVQSRINKCDTKVRVLQDDFFDTLLKLIDNRNDKPTGDQVKNEMYYVRKMKELQTHINHQLNYSRSLQMDLTRSSLEQSFTPHIKSMLIDQYEEKIKELKEESDV